MEQSLRNIVWRGKSKGQNYLYELILSVVKRGGGVCVRIQQISRRTHEKLATVVTLERKLGIGGGRSSFSSSVLFEVSLCAFIIYAKLKQNMKENIKQNMVMYRSNSIFSW